MVHWKVCGIVAGEFSQAERSGKVGGSRFPEAELVKR